MSLGARWCRASGEWLSRRSRAMRVLSASGGCCRPRRSASCSGRRSSCRHTSCSCAGYRRSTSMMSIEGGRRAADMRKSFLLHHVSKSNSSHGMHALSSPAGTLRCCSHSKIRQQQIYSRAFPTRILNSLGQSHRASASQVRLAWAGKMVLGADSRRSSTALSSSSL